MTRYGLAVLFSLVLTGPALADCHDEIDAVWSVVEASELTDAEKNQVATVLEGARQQYEAGDADGCMATVDQVKLALAID